jgi:tRNA G18 (ribose-2'-O)-methylase SpoU
MKNNLESLNAGVSGSIIMYQIANGGKNVRS